jgi:hypothetical protein
VPKLLRSNRSRRRSHRALTCCRCTAPIPAGDVYLHDHGEPVHEDCLDLYVRPLVQNRHGGEPPRYLTDSPIGRPCEGCGDLIDGDDVVVHVSARPWHRECRKGWASR